MVDGTTYLDGPLRCDAVFVMPRTQSQICKKKPMPRIPHQKKLDRDNLDKALMDALKGLRGWMIARSARMRFRSGLRRGMSNRTLRW